MQTVRIKKFCRVLAFTVTCVFSLIIGTELLARPSTPENSPTSAAPAPASAATAETNAAKTALSPQLEAMMADRIMGEAKAPITIIEYSSFTCGHCAAFQTEVLPAIKKNYIDTGKVRLIARDFPIGARAAAASMLVRCVPVDQYYTFVELLFKNQAKWSYAQDFKNILGSYARLGGMDAEKFDTCLNNQDLLNAINAETTAATERYNITGTPTFIITSEGAKETKIGGFAKYEEFAKVFDQLLGGKTAQ